MRFLTSCLLTGLLAFALLAESETPPELANLKYRSIGPAVGGRVSMAVGVPGDPRTYYAATASGGVWKSQDGGTNWEPIFDDQPISSIGSIAIAPSDSNVVYVGSGEANIRGNVAAGNGIYVSTDAGQTWTHCWKEVGQIGDIIVHPTDPRVAYAAVLGHAFGPNRQRGVYRTTDGGDTWEQVLKRDEDTGACDLCFDPKNPRKLFVGLWQARRLPWTLTSGGPGSDLCVSSDGGDTWISLKHKAPDNGLPEGIWGKVGVAVAPSDNRRVYALIEAEEGGLFRSDDEGNSWERINPHRALRQRAWYYSTLTVHPTNPNIVYVPQVPLLRSIDGGKSFAVVKGTSHSDHHYLWIDPADPKRMIDAHDGGVDVTLNGGERWDAPPLPICQFYHIACDKRRPYHVMGCMQDMGTASGPSHSLNASGILLSHWTSVGGGEAGWAIPDPHDPNIVYAGEYGGIITRFDRKTRTARNVSAYPWNPSGIDPAMMPYRYQWTAPIMVSRHTPGILYHAANVLFRSRDGGQTWEEISGDLTRNDKQKQQWAGGPITGDNTGVEVYGTIFVIAEAAVPDDTTEAIPALWVGTDDGRVHLSRDDGKSWTEVTANIPDLPDWGTVCGIEPSPHDPATAYLVVERHRLDDYHPYLWRTTDYGQTWTKLTGDLADNVYLHMVREDPKCKDLLYLGTERGVLFSRDAGQTWDALKLNLPTVAVHDLAVTEHDLVVGTNGRSVWILDDLTPIREWSPKRADRPMHLFPIQPATCWQLHREVSVHTVHASGTNPPNGAVIHYHLKQKASDDHPVRLAILDASGSEVTAFDSLKAEEPPEDLSGYPQVKKTVLPGKAGVNRFVWDLHHHGARIISKAHVDLGDPSSAPLVAPGTYMIRLTYRGKTLATPIVVERDPRFSSPSEAVAANETERTDTQEALALRVRDNLTAISGMVERIRGLRKQLDLHQELLAKDDRPVVKKYLKKQAVLAKQLDNVESALHNPEAQVSYDIFSARGGAKLYSQLTLLLEFVILGEGQPTQGMRRVAEDMQRQLSRCQATLAKLREQAVPRLNTFAREHRLPEVWLPTPKESSAR